MDEEKIETGATETDAQAREAEGVAEGTDGATETTAESATENAADEAKAEKDADDKIIAQATLYKRPKRNGKFVSKLDKATAESLQKRKTLYMYLSTLFFAVSLFLKVEGRTRLSENKTLFALFTLYVLAEVALIVLTVFVAVCGRTSQKIGQDIKEKNVPRDGLDKHTFVSYEIFNALHVLLACGEIAVSVYKFGVWGACNIACSAASAVFCFLSRQILYKANVGNLEYIPARESEDAPPPEKKKKNR